MKALFRVELDDLNINGHSEQSKKRAGIMKEKERGVEARWVMELYVRDPCHYMRLQGNIKISDDDERRQYGNQYYGRNDDA